ncbi:MAG: hypothetical protein JXA00_06595, partial [Candidatus Thermoplasmatota archaeon]|nr:hypothetical protein [Candidatus Thermoplasmatota archaeon]
MQTEKHGMWKASKLTSMLVVLMLVAVAFTVVFVPPVSTTNVTNNGAPAAYVKQSQTDVLVLNFTLTTTADTLLAGTAPSIGQNLSYTDQSNDWGAEAGDDMWFYDDNEDGGEYDWTVDCIFLDDVIDNDRYNNDETVLNGTAPASGTFGTGRGCKHPLYWKHVKAYDAAEGGGWNSGNDAIIYEGLDNNSCYLEELNATTLKLTTDVNGTHFDISTLSIWSESGATTGFQSDEDTRIKTTTYAATTESWNFNLSTDINTSVTFYITANISANASHFDTIKFRVPALADAGTAGLYNYANNDQGIFLKGTNDSACSNFANSNNLTVDALAPVTSASAISGYWKKASDNPLAIAGTAADNCSGLERVALWYRYSADNGSWGGAVRFGNDTTPWSGVSFSFTFSNGSGYYGFFTRGTDNVSNVEGALTTNDTYCGYDVSAPDSTINTPSDSGKNNSLTNISGVVSDTFSGPASVTITIFNDTDNKYWDGNSWELAATNLATTLHSTIWYKTTELPTWTSGKTYIINSSATDTAGNTEAVADSNSFIYDTDAPSVTITTPGDTTWYNAMANITGTAEDTGGSGLDLVNITIYNATAVTGHKYWNGTTWSAVVVNFTVAGTSSWYNASGLPTWMNASTYYINATAKDQAGNVGTEDSHTMYIDTFKPRSEVNDTLVYWKTSAGTRVFNYTSIVDQGSGFKNVTLYYRYDADNASFGDSWVTSEVDADPWVTNSWTFTFTNGSGFYEFYCRARDNATNFEDAPGGADAIAGYDVDLPTSTITVPADNGYYRTGSAIDTNITGTATDAQGLLLVNLTIYNSTDHTYWNTSQTTWVAYAEGVGNITVNLTGSGASRPWYFNDNMGTFPTSWLTDTIYIVNVSCKDGAGNWNTSAASSTFTYDTNNPTITMNNPVNEAWNNTMTNITGIAADTGGSSVALVNITIYNSTDKTYWNGTTWSAVVVNTTATGTTTWYLSSGLPTFTNGTTYVVNATAKDNAGNVGTKDSNTFYMDTDLPVSSVTAISGYWKTTSPQTISYTASENGSGSGLDYVTLYYRYSTTNSSWGGWVSWTDASNPDVDPWITQSFSFNFPNTSGFYQFYTRATDNATNTESAPGSADTVCGYDANNPTVVVLVPENGAYYNAMAQLSGTCADTGYSGINRVNITLYNTTGGTYYNATSTHWEDGVRWISATIQAGYVTWVYDSSGITWTEDESYYVNATAVDNATRTSTADTNLFTLDTTAPTCTIAFNNSRSFYKALDYVRIYANFTTTAGIDPATVVINITTQGNGDVTNTTMTESNNTRWYYDWLVPAGADENGGVTINVYAQDNATNYLNPYPTPNAAKGIDNSAPSCTIAYNNTRTYYKAGEVLKIYANFTADPSGIDESTVYVSIATAGNGDLVNTSMTRNNNTLWYYNWTIPSGSDEDGGFTVSIWASDNATNTLGSYPTQDESKAIDNTAPTCTIGFNNARTYYKDADTVRIYANFTEGGSGIDLTSVIINISTAGNGDTTNTSMTESNGTLWYYDWNVPSGTDEDGAVTIRIYAMDNATNYLDPWSTNDTSKYIDNTAPTCT